MDLQKIYSGPYADFRKGGFKTFEFSVQNWYKTFDKNGFSVQNWYKTFDKNGFSVQNWYKTFEFSVQNW